MAAAVSLAGCAGNDPTTETTPDASTATETPTDSPTQSPTATEAATETQQPTETETEEPTETPDDPSVRLWPNAVTTVFSGDVEAEAVTDALGREPQSSKHYGGQREGETVTYFVSMTSSFSVSDAEDAFEGSDLSVETLYRGVGPDYLAEYESAIGEQAAALADVEPSSVTLSTGRLGRHQYLDIAAPTDTSALVPVLPDAEINRAGDGENSRVVGPDGFSTGEGLTITAQSGLWLDLSLDDSGIEQFADAVADASSAELRGDFFRFTVDGDDFDTFGISQRFEASVEDGEWNGEFGFRLAEGTAEKTRIRELTGLPPVPFDCEPLD
ncbi:hypothetical protein JCM30237_17220 [Halolamina litorea]|uniref:GerMN domain-containing protein n=1 Tax=Halolamina litorea TaxID=1515593 RepID=A0ABD6BR32_9EURY|nr:hypothetical protein [Halolamina litorea]